MLLDLPEQRISNWHSLYAGWEVWVFPVHSFTVLTGENAGEFVQGSPVAIDSPARFVFETELDTDAGELIIHPGTIETTTDSDTPDGAAYIAVLVNTLIIGTRMIPFGIFGDPFQVNPSATNWDDIAAYQVPVVTPENFHGEGTGFHTTKVYWNDNPDASSFEIQRRAAVGAPWVTKFTPAAGAMEQDDNLEALDIGAPYYYRMRALRADGKKSLWTAQLEVYTLELPAPTNWRYTILNLDQVRLNWTDISGIDGLGIDGTRILKLDDDVIGDVFTPIAVVTDTSGTFVATLLTKAHRYRFKAQYYIGAHSGPFTRELIVEMPDIYAPTIITAEVEAGDVVINYNDLNAFETGFEIYRKTDEGAWASVHTTAANVTTWTDSPTKGHRYSYKVRALNAVANSDFSPVVAVTLHVDAPAGMTVTPVTSALVNTTPDAVAEAEAYDIDRAINLAGPWVNLATARTALPYPDTTPPTNTVVYYRSRARNTATGPGGYCAPVNVLTLPGVPAAPAPTATDAAHVSIAATTIAGLTYDLQRSAAPTSGFATLAGAGALVPGDFPFVDSTVTSGVRMYYRMSATNATGASTFSAVASVIVPLAAPAAITRTPISASRVDITPDAVTNADSYDIERSLLPTTGFAVVGAAQTVFPFQDLTVTGGVTYYYRARAKNAVAGYGGYSPVGSVTTHPNAPATITLASTLPTRMNVTPSSVAGASSFKIYRSPTLGGVYALIQAGVTSLPYPDNGVTGGTVFFYKAKATNTTGDSDFSAPFSAMTLLETPGDISITTPSDTEADVTMQAVTGADNYKLERALALAGPYVQIVQTSSLTYPDTGRTPGVTYYYRSRAFSTVVGNSGYSNVTSITMPAPPPAVPGVPSVAAIGSRRVDANVAAVTGATSYVWYRQDNNAGPFNLLAGLTTRVISDTTVLPANSYRYKAAASNAAGTSGQSAQSALVTTEADANVVIDGNGITLGDPYGQAYGNGGMPSKLQTYLNTFCHEYYGFVNLSLGGRTTQTMSTDSANINSHVVGTRSIYFPFDCGSNDVTEQNKTATQALSYLQTLVNNAVAAGYTVILNTLPDRAELWDPTLGATRRGYFATINAAIRAGIPGASGYIDLAALAQYSDCFDLEFYYTDNVHWTDENYRMLAQLLGQMIMSLNSPAVATSVISGQTTFRSAGQAGTVVTLKPADIDTFFLTAIADGSGNYTMPRTGSYEYYLTAWKEGYSYPFTHLSTLTSNQTINLSSLANQPETIPAPVSAAGMSFTTTQGTKTAADGWGTAGYGAGPYALDAYAEVLLDSDVGPRVWGLATTAIHTYTGMIQGFHVHPTNSPDTLTLQFVKDGAPQTTAGWPLNPDGTMRLGQEIRTVSGIRLWLAYVNGRCVMTRSLTVGQDYYFVYDVHNNAEVVQKTRVQEAGDLIPSLVSDGNSIPAGVYNSAPYINRAQTSLQALGSRFRKYVIAVSGQTTPQMTARVATYALPLINLNSDKNVIVGQELRNDLHNNNPSGSVLYSNMVDYITAVDPFDFKIIPNCNDNGDFDAGMETARASANSSLASNAVSLGIVLADIAGDSRFNDFTNALLFADAYPGGPGVHWTDALCNIFVDEYLVPYCLTINPPVMHHVMGHIEDDLGNPLVGVTVDITGDYATSGVTDAGGDFDIQVPEGFNILVTPSFAGYAFSPIAVSHSSLTANVTDDFTGTALSYMTGQNGAGITEEDVAHTLASTGGSDGWTAHHITSNEIINPGDTGEWEFSVPYTNKDIMFGMVKINNGTTYTQIYRGIYLQASGFRLSWADGASAGDSAAYSLNQAFKLRIAPDPTNGDAWTTFLMQGTTEIHKWVNTADPLWLIAILFNNGITVPLPTYTGDIA
jgi:hypothetical protein